MGFCPYFRHEYSSGGISAIFGLIAGTRIVLFTRDFLRVTPDLVQRTVSDWYC